MKSFIVTYEQGYAAGLRRATAVDKDGSDPPQAAHAPPGQTDDLDRSTYQEGFVEGFRDGLETLASLQHVSRLPRRFQPTPLT